MINVNPVIIESLILFAFCGLGAIVSRGKVDWKWIGLAVLTYAAHKFITFAAMHPLIIDLLPGRYNWEGKILGSVFVLVIGLLVCKGNAAAFGWTLKQNGPAVKAGYTVAAFTFIATAMFMYWYFPGTQSAPTADWLYQMTMPSIDEELLYRGVMLLMLTRAFKPSFTLVGAPFGIAVIISILMFYATHIVGVSADWTVTVNWLNIISLFYGMLWVYVRVATGSLLLPILLHSWANTANYIL
ncbi:CPBP family intramembrane metalloprotease [Alteromonas sediminis]|uniref:CPBP family intramembrane metalloprotease n=1 Tax=Alteromonas sediminis TaxID=2259342 RepID=A0A3N5YBV8_9ALTE|nr:CPBP family intramembrane glutamic endopeptidase [Alteromonas sediminis]RPJ66605.1 CPBP family intramembrane metalloprotease [Alteromonas sediminis]